MRRILSGTIIMALAVSLTLLLTVTAYTKAEAASSVEAARQKMLEEDRKQEAAAKAKTMAPAEMSDKAKQAGFIAVSEKEMMYDDAVAFCKRHGGRLPRINNSASYGNNNPPFRGIIIEGFGYGGRPWNEVGLPDKTYWTGTAWTVHSEHSHIVGGEKAKDNIVRSYGTSPRNAFSTAYVVCVP